MKPILAVLILGIAASAAETPLKIGDPAPPIVVAKWFKNEAPGALAGKVTVVEFWATWCGPCKKGIPHLTELAKEYQGKARIIGVSIWEAEKTDHDKRLAAVGKFVDSMGDTMDYSVAADDNAGTMAKTWMEAANENGIPTAFVIGKDGRIAWIGNPWEGLDKALADAVNGRLDTTAIADQAAARQKAKDAKETTRLLLEPVNQLVADNQHAEAVTLLDKLVAGNPELQGKMGYFRYRILKGYDQPAAWRQARALLDGELKDNPGALYLIARDLTDPPGPKTKDWDLALAISKHLVAISKAPNPSYYSTLAESYAGMGQFAKAIETEELAVATATSDESYPEGSRKYLEGRLKSFKNAAAPHQD